jgi:DNA-binding beta-propeller fold protein YncE
MRVLCILICGILASALHAQTILAVQEGPGKVAFIPAADPSHPTAIKVGDKPHEIELSSDGRTAYVSNFGLLEANHKEGTPGTTISVLDVDHHVERARFNIPAGFTALHGLKLRPPKFHELFTNTEEGSEAMIVFAADSGSVLHTFPLPPGVHNFIFNADGTSLYAFTIKGGVYRIDPDSGKTAAHADVDSPRGLTWTADHRYLIASGKDAITFLDPVSLSTARRIENLEVSQIFYTTETPDGRWLLAPAVIDGVILVIDVSTGSVAHRIETGSPLLLALASDGKRAWVSNVLVPAQMFGPGTTLREGGITEIDLTTFKTYVVPAIRDTNGLAISPVR